MIRLATRFELDELVDLVINSFNDIKNIHRPDYVLTLDHDYIKQLLFALLHIAKVWVAENKTNDIIGMLIATKEQQLFTRDVYFLKEVFFYVKPKYQTTQAAAKLFKAYTTYAQTSLNNKEIAAYFIGHMGEHDHDAYDHAFKRRNFKLFEHLYVKV